MDRRLTDEVEPLYERMNCPVTVLWRQNDGWIPYGKGRILAAMISERACIPIPRAGHLVQEDRPEAIATELAKRLAPET